MSDKVVLVEENNGILELTINRPKALNALNAEVLSELAEVLNPLVDKRPIAYSGLLLKGAGEKAFVAGADIKAMNEMSPSQGEEFARLGQRVTRLFEELPFPVVAAVNGFALGGGCELAMSADFIYATHSAVFGQPEVNLGLIPGFGGTQRLFRYIGLSRAKEMIYTGKNMKAEEALRVGLVNKLFDSNEDLLAAARKTLSLIASKSRVTIEQCKTVINRTEAMDIERGLDVEAKGFYKVFETEDKKEGVNAFIEKRAAVFKHC